VADGGKPKNPPIQAAISTINIMAPPSFANWHHYFVDFNKVVHDIT
jgi:hypothetical protein